ncbi:trypsin domain-containing protein [Ditylenchus destructor]|uniref:Trypsin domain-containing protein n=1 Tax=Ditylenchus destructor TaxID=166010 RepID=A0AAD4MRK5_9BILA|nr:trypsin domain-containing protein [Ditylenchus destructor]
MIGFMLRSVFVGGLIMGFLASLSASQALGKYLFGISPEDLLLVKQQCQSMSTDQLVYDNESVSMNVPEIADRIIGGLPASSGSFGFMAVLVDPNTRIPFCGASYVLPWLLITARHCLNYLAPIVHGKDRFISDKGFHLYSGGLCALKSEECVKSDMQEKHYSVVAFDDRHNFEIWAQTRFDIAFIVLDREIKEQLNNEIVCVRQEKDLPATELTSLGWGAIDDAKPGQEYSPVLRYTPHIEAIDIATMKERYEIDLDNKPDRTWTFAIHNRVTSQKPSMGDSGTPILRKLKDEINYEMVGIYSTTIKEKGVEVGIAPRISMYNTELCVLFGLCYTEMNAKGSQLLAINRLMMPMTKILADPAFNIFEKRLSRDESKSLLSCRETDLGPFPIFSQSIWAAAITVNGELVCGASFYSKTHLITASRCLEPYMNQAEDGMLPIFSVYAGLRHTQSEKQTYIVDEKKDMQVGSIVWREQEELMLVELAENAWGVDENACSCSKQCFQPFCLPKHDYISATQNVIIMGWSSQNSVKWMEMYIMSPQEINIAECHTCLETGKKCLRPKNNKETLAPFLYGSGVVYLDYSRTFSGILLYTDQSGTNCKGISVMLQSNNFADELCAYTSLCDEYNYVLVKFPFFDRKYKNDQRAVQILK